MCHAFIHLFVLTVCYFIKFSYVFSCQIDQSRPKSQFMINEIARCVKYNHFTLFALALKLWFCLDLLIWNKKRNKKKKTAVVKMERTVRIIIIFNLLMRFNKRVACFLHYYVCIAVLINPDHYLFSGVQTLDTMQALCLPLGASVSLLIMFFFFDSMQMLFAICTASMYHKHSNIHYFNQSVSITVIFPQ